MKLILSDHESLSKIISTPQQIPAGTVMLVTRRTTTNPDSGQALAIEETRLPADDTQLAYRLHPTTRRALPTV